MPVMYFRTRMKALNAISPDNSYALFSFSGADCSVGERLQHRGSMGTRQFCIRSVDIWEAPAARQEKGEL